MSRISALAIASALLGSAALMPTTAEAALYKFFSGTTAYGTGGGAFSGSGTVYDLVKNESITCPTNVSCSVSSDERGDPLVFDDFVATANGDAEVNEDLRPNFGGLGVESPLNASSRPDQDDQIDGSNVLTLTFNASNVILTGVATLFADGHDPFGGDFADNYIPDEDDLANMGIKINGINYSFAAVNAGGLSIIGLGDDKNVFSFEVGIGGVDTYVSALTTVPLPGAALLFGSALAGLGWMSRRRQAGSPEALPA